MKNSLAKFFSFKFIKLNHKNQDISLREIYLKIYTCKLQNIYKLFLFYLSFQFIFLTEFRDNCKSGYFNLAVR